MRSLEERQTERKLRNQSQKANLRKPAPESRSSYDMSEAEIAALQHNELKEWAIENKLSIPNEVHQKGRDSVAEYIINAKRAKDAAPQGQPVKGWAANN